MVGPTFATPSFADPQPDVLGAGYEALTVELPDDAEGAVVATLVRRRAAATTNRAVLYIHGFSDYFHQIELAEFHAARGEDFYAIDLRKNGRSLLPHQTPTRMADVSDYYPEIDCGGRLHRRRGARPAGGQRPLDRWVDRGVVAGRPA